MQSNDNLTRLASVSAILTLTAAFVLMVAGVRLTEAATAEDTVIRCDPEVVAVNIGEAASFTIFVENVAELYAGDVQMSFDPSIAEVVDADPNRGGTQIEMLEEFLGTDFILRDRADNVAGTIWYANSLVNPSEPVSGSGPLARVTMQSIKAGSFDVAITAHKIVKRGGVEIPSTARNCRVTFFDPNNTSNTYLPISIAP